MSVATRRLVVPLVALLVATAGVFVIQRANAASSDTPTVYVATGENFPDALGAGPAAAMIRGPILLVSQNGVPGATATELNRLSPDKIIIVGGTAVVSPGVENALKAYAGTVERIAGSNRYETAAKLSAATFPAAIAGGGDADTLDGKDSTAFASSSHNHDGTYLATDGKAVDADLFDGKDSSTFVEHGNIVMAASCSHWRPHGGSGPDVGAYGTHAFVADEGYVEIGLDAPATIGGVNYQLKSVEICYELGDGGYIDQTAVLASSIGSALAQELTDHTASGCHTVDVSGSAPYGATVRLNILDSDGAGVTANLFGVRATWTPAP